jgi:subtilase family serine protease
MRKTMGFGGAFLATALFTVAGCGAAGEGASDEAAHQAALTAQPDGTAQVHTRALCDHSETPGVAHCYARVRTDESGIVQFAATPKGLGPSDLQKAYKIPTSGGAGKIIAIVDAQDDPNAESDLAVYRAQYGLPPCTTANGCFKKVNQDGAASPLPKADSGWAGEISLDLDMASAGCPDCKILLVEANSADMADLGAAELMAVKMGAVVVSNSFGGPEDNTIAATDAMYFNHPGVSIFVSAGDSGYATEYPASSQYVTAVGGTTLTKDTSARGYTEKVWGSWLSSLLGGTGSGCSKYIPKPAWQKDGATCKQRTVADVSAVADPATGPAVYDTYGGMPGWLTVGGTSAASPLVAAIYAVTGRGGADGSLSYANPTAFFDVTSGNNGLCSPGYLCTGKAGYDGPTGNGTPNGSALAALH